MRDFVITRVEWSGPPRTSRNLEERLMARFPGAYRGLIALGQRLLSPRSRLRRAYLRRSGVLVYDAASRRDDELVLVRYSPDFEVEFDPDFEVEFDPDFEPLGIAGTFRGHTDFVDMGRFADAWERWDFEPVAFVDMGDQFLALNRIRVLGAASGVELERDSFSSSPCGAA